MNPSLSNRQESFSRSRFARDSENIVDLDFEGGLKMLSSRFDQTDTNCTNRLKFVATF